MVVVAVVIEATAVVFIPTSKIHERLLDRWLEGVQNVKEVSGLLLVVDDNDGVAEQVEEEDDAGNDDDDKAFAVWIP